MLRANVVEHTDDRAPDAAMPLFLERGFEATTVDDIATAVDISKRSFFDYFPTQEDVISAWQDAFGDALAAAVAAGEPLGRTVEEPLTSSIVPAADPQALAIGQLIGNTPALRARDQLKYAKLEQRLVEALAERAAGQEAGLSIRLLAMIAIGALRVGGDAWQSRGRNEPIEAFTRKIFDAIRAELRGFGQSGGAR
jgi:AcrR family transcriptional regulator